MLYIWICNAFVKVPGFLGFRVELVYISRLKTSLLLILFLLCMLLKATV
jgi:hypothetical protein